VVVARIVVPSTWILVEVCGPFVVVDTWVVGATVTTAVVVGIAVVVGVGVAVAVVVGAPQVRVRVSWTCCGPR